MAWGNVPWIVMAIGSLRGGLGLRDFFRLREENPYGLAFVSALVLLWFLGTRWIFEKGEAAVLVRHPGLFNVPLQSESAIKTFWLLSVARRVAGLGVMYFLPGVSR